MTASCCVLWWILIAWAGGRGHFQVRRGWLGLGPVGIANDQACEGEWHVASWESAPDPKLAFLGAVACCSPSPCTSVAMTPESEASTMHDTIMLSASKVSQKIIAAFCRFSLLSKCRSQSLVGPGP